MWGGRSPIWPCRGTGMNLIWPWSRKNGLGGDHGGGSEQENSGKRMDDVGNLGSRRRAAGCGTERRDGICLSRVTTEHGRPAGMAPGGGNDHAKNGGTINLALGHVGSRAASCVRWGAGFAAGNTGPGQESADRKGAGATRERMKGNSAATTGERSE
jgi:hypothetical protein